MNSIYEAVPLDRDISSTNIRVIEDLVRDVEGRISCKLRTITLEWEDDELRSQRSESYLALSYTWGPPDVGKSILIDGKPFEVRDNLWDFLNEACTRGTFTRNTTFTGKDWRNVYPGTYIPE
ncbi:HET domain containing protein [Alternaria sp. MG1]|nr:HET domain containing protein [Alternaria sp. MG1]